VPIPSDHYLHLLLIYIHSVLAREEFVCRPLVLWFLSEKWLGFKSVSLKMISGSVVFPSFVCCNVMSDLMDVVCVCVMQTAGVSATPKANNDVRPPVTQQRRSLNLDDYKKKRGLIWRLAVITLTGLLIYSATLHRAVYCSMVTLVPAACSVLCDCSRSRCVCRRYSPSLRLNTSSGL